MFNLKKGSVMSTVILHIKLESDLAENARELAKSMGMDVPTAVRIFLSQFVRDRKFPFTPSASDPVYSKENVDFLLKSYKEVKAGKCIEKTIDELEKMAQ